MFRILHTYRKRPDLPGLPQISQLISILLVTVAMLHRCTAEEPGDLHLGNIAERFRKWDVVAVPDRKEPEWWAGAPSIARDDAGVFWMAARMRTADAPLGERGYELRIYRSADGVKFIQADRQT